MFVLQTNFLVTFQIMTHNSEEFRKLFDFVMILLLCSCQLRYACLKHVPWKTFYQDCLKSLQLEGICFPRTRMVQMDPPLIICRLLCTSYSITSKPETMISPPGETTTLFDNFTLAYIGVASLSNWICIHAICNKPFEIRIVASCSSGAMKYIEWKRLQQKSKLLQYIHR